MNAQPHPQWITWLEPHFHTPAFQALQDRLKKERQDQVFPPASLRYAALALPPEDVRVVILGQDPYHGRGQAMGLSFSVPDGVPPPRSLVNIFKEIEQETGKPAKGRSGNLIPWRDQGVLLLNTALSVHEGQAGSHRGWGWEGFTDGIIQELAQREKHLVFMLWGSHAQEKAPLIPSTQGHLILKAAHPSPLSAHRGFFGCNHFNQANAFLVQHGYEPIDW